MPEQGVNSVHLERRHCALCGPGATQREKFAANFSDADLNAAIFSARRLPDRRHFRLAECQSCGMIFSDPACPPEILANLYSESSVTYQTQEEEIYDSYAPVLDRALSNLGKRELFVEIGGGRGFMLRYGRERGFSRQIEIEPSADAERNFEALPGATFLRGMFATDSLAPKSADLICFFQVLDHIPNPAEFLVNVHRALAPGGAAVCVTHDTSALSAKVLRERSPIYDIEHTYLFNPSNLTKLFKAAGFQRTESFAVANDYSLRHWLRTAPLPTVARRSLVKGLEAAGIANFRARLYAGNFGVVAQKAL